MLLRLRRLLPVVLFFAPGPPTAAQEAGASLDPSRPLTEFNISLWSEDDGLPQNMASAIAETPDGFIWLGMEEGLARFDGATFRVFGPDNEPAFTTPWVTSLWTDGDGTLWVGTAGGGLIRHRNGDFQALTTEDGLPHDNVRGLARAPDGTLWIGTEGGGIAAMDPDGTLRTVSTTDGLANDFVLSVAISSDGAVWVGTVGGLSRIGPGGDIRSFALADGLPGMRVTALHGSSDGSIWVGTAAGGLARYRNETFTSYGPEAGLSSTSVTALHEDDAGTLWIGTNGGGLNRWVDGAISSLTAARGLPGNLILSLAGDRNGGLWLGMTGAGLGRMSEGMVRVLGRPEGLSADIALALMESADGALWVGTAGGGVNRVLDGEITAYTTTEGLAHNVVLALASGGGAGDVWVGTPGGLSRIRDGAVTSFGPDDGLASSQVTDVAVTPDGDVWVATPGAGVQRWDGGDAGRITVQDGLPSDVITALHPEDDGSLWVGTRDGLGHVVEGVVEALDVGPPGSPANSVNDVTRGPDGHVWVSTNGGVSRIAPDGTVSLFGPQQGPFGGQIHAAVQDSLGYLWISSNDGIARIRVADLDAVTDGALDRAPATVFSRADGLRSEEANGGVNPAGLQRSDGSIWFPTMRGAARFEPTDSIPPRPTPIPVLEFVVVEGIRRPPTDGVTLPPDARALEFHFTAPTFVAPEEINFRYLLEGFDEDWVEAGTRRQAFYTALPPGAYRFRVQARRGDGPWGEAEGFQTLTLQPHFWETVWFRVLAALTVLALAWGAYRLRIRRLEQRQRELLALTAEQQRAERALRESRERLELALESGKMGTWAWDLHSGRVSFDRAAEEMLGVQAGHLDDVLLQLRDRVQPDALERLSALPEGLRAGETSVHMDFSVHGLRGGTRHVELRGQMFFENGRRDHVVGVVADVTELMTAQSELRIREEELRHAQKMEAVGRLAGGVAHDFNNLLTTILGRTQFLKDVIHEEEAREDLEEIQKSAERAANLTQQLLTFSRKQIMQPRLVDLNYLIDDLQRMLKRLLREDVVLETRLAAFLPRIHADPGSMEQVLVNLVVNAQDAMPRGGQLRIETTLGTPGLAPNPELAKRPFVVLTVRDTGEGMSEETLQHAFDPFFTTKPVGKGTGLGLATVYGIVQQCGGEIRVDTRLGEGTTFRIYLPASRETLGPDREAGDAEAGDAPEVPGTGKGSGPARTVATDAPRRSVLLVEDDDAVRPLMSKILTRHGYDVLHAASGLEALALCRDETTHIDLLLSDVVMPGMSGRELLEAARELRPELTALLVSGHHDDEILRRGVDADETAFLRKPFDASTLLAAVDGLLVAEKRD